MSLAGLGMLLLHLAVCTASSSVLPGPYAVKHAVYSVPALDSSDPSLSVTYPVGKFPNETFPLISYAHGAAGGGWYTFAGYFALWEQMASYGLIIAATKSCTMGCKEGGWDTFYEEQLKTIEFARNSSTDPVLRAVNWDPTVGVGICGHSMGGQATVRSAAAEHTSLYNIRAAALHHPEVDNGGSSISVPLAAFTGDADHICPASETHTIYDPAPAPKTLRNQKGANHLEPVLIPPIEDPLLAKYTAAFFRAVLLKDGAAHAQFYGNGTSSLCKSAPMVECGSVLR